MYVCNGCEKIEFSWGDGRMLKMVHVVDIKKMETKMTRDMLSLVLPYVWNAPCTVVMY